MKIIFVSILCLILIGITSYSHAQYTEVDSNTKVPEVMLQLVLRDSDGNFLTYIEGKQIITFYPLELNEFLDNQNYKKFLVKDGITYEIIQWQAPTETFTGPATYSQFTLWELDNEQFKIALTIRHNSYQTQPGDTITVYWTVIRPAN